VTSKLDLGIDFPLLQESYSSDLRPVRYLCWSLNAAADEIWTRPISVGHDFRLCLIHFSSVFRTVVKFQRFSAQFDAGSRRESDVSDFSTSNLCKLYVGIFRPSLSVHNKTIYPSVWPGRSAV
jgi:hypothetical protein